MNKKLIAFNGSRRKNGNTSILLDNLLQGAEANHIDSDVYNADGLNLEYCRGCLRCNMLGYCSIQNDDWTIISKKILEANVLVFATPIYFHHVSAPLKILIDRFRSFIKVKVTETGLLHTPHHLWEKDFILLLTMGSSDIADAAPVIDLFTYMVSILGSKNRLHVISVNRMVVVNQILKNDRELKVIYEKLQLPLYLAEKDAAENKRILDEAYRLGATLMK